MSSHRNFRFGSEYRLFKLKAQILSQIRSSLRARAATAVRPKNVSEPEKLSKNIAQILKSAGIETARSACGVRYPGMSEAVIHRSLLAVDQNRVRFSQLFKFFFRVRIIRITVRMVLHGKLAVSALDFLFGTRPRYSKYFVIIAFSVTGQNGIPPVRDDLAKLS